MWSADNYYAPGLYERVAWGEALRIGLAHYNTLDEMDRFNETLASLVAEQAGMAGAAAASARGTVDDGLRQRPGWSGGDHPGAGVAAARAGRGPGASCGS